MVEKEDVLTCVLCNTLFVDANDKLVECSRVAQGAYLEIQYIRNVLSVSGTSKYADSGTA